MDDIEWSLIDRAHSSPGEVTVVFDISLLQRVTCFNSTTRSCLCFPLLYSIQFLVLPFLISLHLFPLARPYFIISNQVVQKT